MTINKASSTQRTVKSTHNSHRSTQVELQQTLSNGVTITVQRQLEFNQALNEQECHYLYLVAQGYTLAAIAESLGLNRTAIDNCQKSIHDKLHCHHDAQAVYKGIHYTTISTFSPLEQAFLYLLASGYNDTEIVKSLQKIDATITEAHLNTSLRDKLYKQLHCHNDAEMLFKGIQAGLITGLNTTPDF